jgi:hypothetical protein
MHTYVVDSKKRRGLCQHAHTSVKILAVALREKEMVDCEVNSRWRGVFHDTPKGIDRRDAEADCAF